MKKILSILTVFLLSGATLLHADEEATVHTSDVAAILKKVSAAVQTANERITPEDAATLKEILPVLFGDKVAEGKWVDSSDEKLSFSAGQTTLTIHLMWNASGPDDEEHDRVLTVTVGNTSGQISFLSLTGGAG